MKKLLASATTKAGAARYAEQKLRRVALLDLEALDQNPMRADLEERCRVLMAEAAASETSDRFRSFWKAFAAKMIDDFQWCPPDSPVRRVSLSAPADVVARRTGRVVAMVHELHKAGYQRLRISPGMSGSGVHWRCPITYAANIADDGYSIIRFDWEGEHVAPYSSSEEGTYFGWPDSKCVGARELATKFLERFSNIAAHGQGRDWAYAGWLTDLLGRIEQGQLSDYPVFYADYPLAEGPIQQWQPPPPPR
jgi:hypothetical protein